MMSRPFVLFAVLVAVCAVVSQPTFAASSDDVAPPTLRELQELPLLNPNIKIEEPDEDSGISLQIRQDAIKEAAFSFGARGGLAMQTLNIRKELDKRDRYLDKAFNFRQLLIPAGSGLLMEPPVVSESINAVLVEGGGQEAAVADRIYNINRNARLVSSARDWRLYLDRRWGDVDPPPDLLRPQNETERENWRRWVEDGWKAGIQQANDIFQADLDRMIADFLGMVRYRMLLAQGMISKPYALHVDRGVTGGGNEMRVGDRALRITGPSQLKTSSDKWQPANR